jgi:limonene-1,2-epoxide hydrolase
MAFDDPTRKGAAPSADSGQDELIVVTGRFFAAWGESYEAFAQAFRGSFDSATDWDQRPMIRTTGVEEAIDFLERGRKLGIETIDVDVLGIAAAGSTVFSERVDHLRRPDGTLLASVPVTGVMRFEGMKIATWREYFNPGGLLVQFFGSAARRIVGRSRTVPRRDP